MAALRQAGAKRALPGHGRALALAAAVAGGGGSWREQGRR